MPENLLDEFDFIDNLIIGKHVWTAKPNLKKTPSFKRLFQTLIYLFVFIIVSLLMIFPTFNLLGIKMTPHLYQVVIVGSENQEGTINIMIKKTPSKKEKINISKKMNQPNLSFEGILDYKNVAQLLVDKRNAAVYELLKTKD